MYVADPMCSWCWGFSPVMAAVAERFADRAPVAVRLGGLATGASRVMDAANKSMVREHWRHVEEATGQPFNHGFFSWDGFVYDTEPACRAVVAARRLASDRALPFLKHLHAAFYCDNRDITQPDTLCDLAEDFGFERARFTDEAEHEGTHRETQSDFSFVRRIGITGFPALLGLADERLTAITVGYRPLEEVQAVVETWLGTAGLAAT